MLNSAQHARSAASRLDDVIDRSALEQAREGFRRPGYIEELLIGLGVQKSTLEVRDGSLSPPRNSLWRGALKLKLFVFLFCSPEAGLSSIISCKCADRNLPIKFFTSFIQL